ncbi:MAG: Mur ligase family protein, partial [Actinobacteria bacterium]|nr:Mur ligase family protein [Actinomycetota bacterium]
MIELLGRNVLVIGLGASGSAAIEVLLGEGARVRLSEARGDIPVSGSLQGVDIRSGGHDASHLDGIELVVTSPGVPQDAPILDAARSADIPIWSELELGASRCTVPYVAVTGTNGKTTTTEMIASAMRESGSDAIACGNIGHPFSLAAKESHDALA